MPENIIPNSIRRLQNYTTGIFEEWPEYIACEAVR